MGAVVGAAGGAYFAEQDAGKNRIIDELEVRLDEQWLHVIPQTVIIAFREAPTEADPAMRMMPYETGSSPVMPGNC